MRSERRKKPTVEELNEPVPVDSHEQRLREFGLQEVTLIFDQAEIDVIVQAMREAWGDRAFHNGKPTCGAGYLHDLIMKAIAIGLVPPEPKTGTVELVSSKRKGGGK